MTAPVGDPVDDALDDSVVTTADLVDVLETGDGAVVLVERESQARVVRVSEIGLAVLTLASGRGVPTGELGRALASRYGAPDGVDLSDAVAAVVAELAVQGLVTVSARSEPAGR